MEHTTTSSTRRS